ncbi:MAG: (2Fe-2S)-binding protein [Gemmatimonadetes bacterium]|jgi:isoquinoline 1-oxidoreductase alpha subunit|nr:(2Fe-2S)-binding protein [Gemmatimonadota bacterium]HNV74204.1 (2Fe-2S)-binding protein [Gemmatimonadaceae bacterium]MBK6456868.1 (2Fe-2S)-binding protein [Gemmatimonadota bacterium]MBK6845008.1 (2Fe-2S)-binding protein [Gemmatimonadota bacterium]MBK7831642.1 (2Fe-2S)-binding protein [Gemmatimonadota bacterium]
MKTKLTVNGKTHEVDADPDTPLLWVLRDHLGLTGTKYGCGIARCGACTVHVDGRAVRSCRQELQAVGAAKVVTIEELEHEARGKALQDAWIEFGVPQCGYCQSGFLMAATTLLARTPNPTDAEIDTAISNLCRCGTYPRMRAAIHAAARRLTTSEAP